MDKELSEMTLEELWEMFPIFLVEHDDKWNEYYKEIESTITYLLDGYPVKRISHIGSTAIQGIWAKNIIDVMVEISEKADMEEIAHILVQNGFNKMSELTIFANGQQKPAGYMVTDTDEIEFVRTLMKTVL